MNRWLVGGTILHFAAKGLRARFQQLSVPGHSRQPSRRGVSSNGSRPISLNGWERPAVAQLARRATSSPWFALGTTLPPLSTTPTRGEVLGTRCCQAHGVVGRGGTLDEGGFRERSFGGGGFPGGEGFQVKRVFRGCLQDIFVQAISSVSHSTLSIQFLNKPSSCRPRLVKVPMVLEISPKAKNQLYACKIISTCPVAMPNFL